MQHLHPQVRLCSLLIKGQGVQSSWTSSLCLQSQILEKLTWQEDPLGLGGRHIVFNSLESQKEKKIIDNRYLSLHYFHFTTYLEFSIKSVQNNFFFFMGFNLFVLFIF